MAKLNLKRIGIIFVFLIFLSILSFISGEISLEKQVKISQERYQATLQELSQKTVEYTINKKKGEVKNYRITPKKNSTVFSLLEELAKREDFEVKSTIYPGMGVFIESINGVKNGTDGRYWQYWVNDKLGEVAADKKEIKGGDKIEWRFEVPAF
ncbi:MAG: hypothetical protein CO034_02810 [Parcubacteria group bacterium CG_4_9_14_0_2_um_filter_35_11]|nr:MAG: hypothetical protein COS98_01060 [Parcubacteria group bacterium CG07_land_8_20_14_0_80_35_11]PJC47354.1 MAG: hypothetical protein CO034_02810 [Parcubacteria group bacterium CG_4_9_14_0_2_um_filter_35_11]